MAEAVKPSTTKQKNRTNSIELKQELEETRGPVTDSNLEQRLKSLKSFINNIEPTPIEQIAANEIKIEAPIIETNKPEIQSEPITKEKEPVNINPIKEQSKLEVKNIYPSAPVAVQQPLTQNILSSTSSAVDYNSDKIKQLNKLNYPKLTWNRQKSKQLENDYLLTRLNAINRLEPEQLEKNLLIDSELLKFFDKDLMCKELEVYYKCKHIQYELFDQYLDDFIKKHSHLNEFKIDFDKHEFHELLKDYYEARLLVKKCIHHMNQFKWECLTNQMRLIWSFEKYTIESSGVCGDQQRVKHELTSEKAYLNKTELNKFQSMLYDLRLNLIKNGLISSQFCSKLARIKLESYLFNFIQRIKQFDFKLEKQALFLQLNTDLKVLVDILFYFNRKQAKPTLLIKTLNGTDSTNKQKRKYNEDIYSEIDDTATAIKTDLEDDDEESQDEAFKTDIEQWLQLLIICLSTQSDYMRQSSMLTTSNQQLNSTSLIFQYSSIHFDNIFYLVQHFLHSPESFSTQFSYLFQVPLFVIDLNDLNLIKQQLDLILSNEKRNLNFKNNQFQQLNLNDSQSDLLIKIYFDFYLKLFASFSYQVKYRKEFLFINIDLNRDKYQKTETDESLTSNWELIDQDGDAESLEQTLIDNSEDDLIKLYYQIPFNNLFNFLFSYLSYQTKSEDKKKKVRTNDTNNEFRKRYVLMIILSFLDNLARLSIRTLLVYNRTKYKNFSKLIGKTLKDSIKFASVIINTFVDLNDQESEKFYQHYDHFVKRIFATIIYSNRVRSIRWTLLSQLNIGQLCLRTKWIILSIMAGIDVFHENFESVFNRSIQETNSSGKPQDYIKQSCENDLESILNGDSTDFEQKNKLSDIELLSFMRSVHFLINFNTDYQQSDDDFNEILNEVDPKPFDNQFKNNKENTFMNCVIKVVFKIAYCYETTREICHKEGNSLLFAICSTHPQLIGTILDEIDLNLDKIGKKALYLGAELPFSLWLPHIDCNKDINFIEKCLLSTATNSILFNLATKCIDSINFKQDTTALSNQLINQWNNQNSFRLNNKISLSHLIQIKLAFILFELHSRLTIYNYYNQTQMHTATPSASMNFLDESFQLEINYSARLNISSREELNSHYNSKLTRDKRVQLVNWIWSTLNRINLFVGIDSTIDYLDHLTQAYSTTKQNKLFVNVHLNSLFSQFLNGGGQLSFHEQNKCPLEKYFNLIFNSSSELNSLIEPYIVDSVQSILSSHSNKPQLIQSAYLLLFNWLENIIFKYSTVKLNSNQQTQINEFRIFKQQNSAKLSPLLLMILNPIGNHKVTDQFCNQIYKQLNKFNSLNQLLANKPQLCYQNEENSRNYLSLWIEVLISVVKNWHKYKNIVKLLDFLIAYSFSKQNQLIINNDLLDEFMSYVRIDFNIIPTQALSNYINSEAEVQQPKQNWLNNSLSFVSSTATHLTETFINTVSYNMSSSNGDFDSNQPNQFTYDKRLYKEFPYVGLYLSLCEERLEQQLSLWSTFRSCLLSNETNNDSSSYIDSCWKKTLQNVNKTHCLNLNIAFQRLMLFKWCERALELAHDHPLLIIYWQKFFTCYLDKDYSNLDESKPVESPTLKLFSSTSQLNSLLKQMKKQLELTSQHYAYICHSGANSTISAPSLNYDSNEFMSKLYYALSLWVDETRLHDPSLYLPALPNHYEPNLLAKIYSKQSELWFQFVDLNKLKTYIYSIVSKQDHSSNSSNGNKTIIELFFKQDDRLRQPMPNVSQLNVRLQCALKEKFSVVDLDHIQKEQAQLILNISEHLIKNIFKYNKEIINTTLNYMLKLDDKLTNKLLTNLWNNELCEKYIQVACTSLINPMHQCTRPAMIKFVYEIATKRDQYRHEIKENRYNYEKLLSNFVETKMNSNRFPNDDVIKSMVSMNQLVKQLLRNHHQNPTPSTQLLLSKLFYLLIDSYESQMHHSNDVINSLNETNSNKKSLDEDWSLITMQSSNKLADSLSNEQYLSSDSIHLFMFDLINLIGVNFVQIVTKTNLEFRKKNQQNLLEKIIQKLVRTSLAAGAADQLALIQQSSSNSSSIVRKSNNILINLTRNKLVLMSLCAQFVEPNDLDTFNELYNSILSAITSILINGNNVYNSNLENNLEFASNYDTIETINFKLSIILQLLAKFSFCNLNKLIQQQNYSNLNILCTLFVDSNINFLMDLKLESLIDQQLNENNLKLIIDQCFDNFVSILNINYPFYFDYMLQKCLEFSSRPIALKYGSKFLTKLNIIIQQNELTQLNQKSVLLDRSQLEHTFRFLTEFFGFEREKYKSQTRSFYNHWFCYIPQISDIYTNLFLIYLDRYVIKDLIGNEQLCMEMKLESNFERKYDQLWNLLLSLYSVWIDPKSILELTSQSVINVKEIFDSESVNEQITPGSAVLVTINSFLNLFNIILERFNLFLNINYANGKQLQQMARNYALNKFLHFYYEQIACVLNQTHSSTSVISSINENTLDCFHKSINKYSSKWFSGSSFETDYRSINILSELCLSSNSKLITFIAFDLVAYLDISFIIESYFKKEEIKPIQINDLLKCWLQLLTEFCLRDSIRETVKFQSMLRPIYAQAEILECWSMLSDESYADVVINRFCQLADYRYAFASRGTDRGLLMNLLKSSAEFYSLADRNNFMSSFSSAKRRLYLKALSEILLKPTAQTIRLEIESFQACIMNLLTDIETFSISSDDSNNKSLRHEIQLLIDELLCLISSSGRSTEVSQIYASMFETWLESSKDSPILIDFINRISRNYSLMTSCNNAETYCNLLELCIEVYFQTDHTSNWQMQKIDPKPSLYPVLEQFNEVENESIGWAHVMNNIEFKLNVSKHQLDGVTDDLFEYKFLQHSSYLLLYAYMSQRLALFKAIYTEQSNSFIDSTLNYTSQLLDKFSNTDKLLITSRPRENREETFILVLNRILEFYIQIFKQSKSAEPKIVEQLIQLGTLLTFYGEETLSNQNPINDSQSLLASIGINILAKKSPFSVQFRLFARCMSVAILKKLRLVNGIYSFHYASSESVLSSSPVKQVPSNDSASVLHQRYKQSAYQFHLIFQTKCYSSEVSLIDVATYVSDYLQSNAQSTDNKSMRLVEILDLSKYLCKSLFSDKFYLF